MLSLQQYSTVQFGGNLKVTSLFPTSNIFVTETTGSWAVAATREKP